MTARSGFRVPPHVAAAFGDERCHVQHNGIVREVVKTAPIVVRSLRCVGGLRPGRRYTRRARRVAAAQALAARVALQDARRVAGIVGARVAARQRAEAARAPASAGRFADVALRAAGEFVALVATGWRALAEVAARGWQRARRAVAGRGR